VAGDAFKIRVEIKPRLVDAGSTTFLITGTPVFDPSRPDTVGIAAVFVN
jgi:hypothetical protein